jgi:hypothetical protein
MISREFVLAGRAVFTVEPPAATCQRFDFKSHYTFKVKHKEASGQYREAWFVQLLSGPDNASDYMYLGMLHAQTGAVRTTDKSCLTSDSIPVRIVDKVLRAIFGSRSDAISEAGWKVHHEGRCARCGRPLTVPASIERGLGDECNQHVNGSVHEEADLDPADPVLAGV